MSYDIEPYVFDGEVLDEAVDCEIGLTRFCTNENLELVEDQFESDVNNNPGQYIWACPECLDEYYADI